MNVINLRFCHCSQLLLSPTPNPNLPFSQTAKLTLRNPSTPSAISCKNSFYSPIRASMASSSVTDTETKPFSVLFVCLGNICRSPAAEGVFTDLVNKRGLNSDFKIDSAGTIGYHEGNEADPRMRAASKRRGIQITSISRPIKPSDFVDFDLILAMDKQNREDILKAFNRWKARHSLPDDAHKKVELMCSYCKKHDESEVPDPYYGGSQGFEKVLDLLEDACGSLLATILAENKPVQES
ncbi:tyrosine phosphatase [Spatholobus suberectus]|nr:tyrosine phosphatase [Spatholobus suberectus]